MFDEEYFKSLCKWKRLQEVPDLPFESFGHLQQTVETGEYALDLSYPAARELVPVTRTPSGRIANLILALLPWLVIPILVGAALWTEQYLILIGIPGAIIAHWLGNPIMPGHGLFSLAISLATLTLLYTVWTGQAVVSWLLFSVVVPFLSNRFMYSTNLTALRNLATRSEIFFLYLYERFAVRVRNYETGQEYWNR